MEPPQQSLIPLDFNVEIYDHSPDPQDCPICEERKYSFPLKKCGHANYCQDCLKEHCQFSLHNNQLPILCPKYQCEEEIQKEDLQQLMSPREYARSVRLVKLRQNPNLRECPRCEIINEFKGIDKDHPIIECQDCHLEFCLNHGTAHPITETCSAFDLKRQNTAEEKLTSTILNQFKTCPNCSRVIELVEGTCDHVKCPCGTKFCYRCGVSDWSGKYSPKCNRCGTEYIDHDYFWCYFWICTCCFPFWVPFALLFVCCSVCCLPWIVWKNEVNQLEDPKLTFPCWLKLTCCCSITCCIFGHCTFCFVFFLLMVYLLFLWH